MRPNIIVILCVDADPDSPAHGGMRYDCPDRLTWEHLPKLTSKIQRVRKDLLQRFGKTLQLTWFLRSDLQIRTIYGDAGWCFREFEPLLKDLQNAGDELAWHPHAWRWSDVRKCWYNEMTDIEYIMQSYDEGFEAFKDSMGFQPASCRAGINFHSNRTLAKLDELGVKVDLSAHPSIRLFYTTSRWGGFIREGSDWSRTQPEPYHPSRNDYQRPATGNESLDILEIPITTWRRRVGSLSYLEGLVPIRIHRRPLAVRPIVKGWFVPSVWADSFRFEVGVKDVLRRAKASGTAHYASYLHSDDISDELHYQNFTRNLDYLISVTNASNCELEFVTASLASEAFRGNT